MKDLDEIITCLEVAMVFNNACGRKHRAFTFAATHLETVDIPKTVVWLTEHIKYTH